MKLLSFADSGRLAFGIHFDGRLIDLSRGTQEFARAVLKKPAPSSLSIIEFLEEGYWRKEKVDEILHFLQQQHLVENLALQTSYKILPPIPRPPKIIALGRNYALHAQESKMPVPSEPIIFSKASSSVIGPADTILLPKDVGRVDHEVELAVVIGKRGKSVKAADAYEYVAGYTIALDISARDLQRADIEKRNPWFRSKSFDTFTPLGPWIVTADEVTPPIELDIELSVNSAVRQKANTRMMIFDIPTTIEFITRYITLEPGDVLLMGTPEGIGPIQDGDLIVSRIEKIGEMRNTVKEI
jgi:2-keto-4-pentenoate hydratase/2-oxohepta-3-ene-1,7-dioic acid hydratase in catechol pathway